MHKFSIKNRKKKHAEVTLADALLDNPILTDGVASSTYQNTLSSLRSSMKNQGVEGYGISRENLKSYAPNGVPAAEVGSQAKIVMKPEAIVPWVTFDEDVELATTMDSEWHQLILSSLVFSPRQVRSTRSREETSTNMFMDTFGKPFPFYYSSQFEGDDPRQTLTCSYEYTLPGCRIDFLWTLNIEKSDPYGVSGQYGCATSLDEYPVLPHEHKNPRTFPFLAEQFQELDAYFDDKNDVNEDEDKNRKPPKGSEAEIEFLQKKWSRRSTTIKLSLRWPMTT